MMKYYTMKWWCGELPEEAPNPIHGYRAHLDTIADRLPAALLELQESFALHDARLASLSLSETRDTLTLVLEGDDGHGE